jgi:hypothetical protein
MANEAYTKETVQLQGWKKPIEIRPLTVKRMRGLMRIFDKLQDQTVEEQVTLLDVMIEACAHCMKTFEPKLAEKRPAFDEDGEPILDEEGNQLEEYVLEEYADMQTMDRILEVAGGIKLNDPNLTAAMAAAGTRD